MKYVKYVAVVLAISVLAACAGYAGAPVGGHCNDGNYPQCVQGQ